MESDPAANVYSEAKSEYMMQLSSYLTPAYFTFFLELLEHAREGVEAKRHLWEFQNLLAEVENWNMERVTREVGGIVANCTKNGCDFLDDLLTAVFLAHTKVLMAIRVRGKKNENVRIFVPNLDRFLFKVFCECSKLLWQSAYLFRDNVGGMEKQQNYRQVQQIIESGIRAAIRAMVPVKSLLKDFVSGGSGEAPDSDSDEEELKTEEPKEDESKAEEPVKELEDKELEHKELEPVVEGSKEAEDEKHDPLIEEIFKQMNASSTKNPISSDPNLIIVDDDDSKGVHFNEYETIFDMGDEDGHHIQPTTFPQLENRPPEEDDDEESLKILDDIGSPLGSDDVDDISSIVSHTELDDFDEL
jgi:hypothetical protein